MVEVCKENRDRILEEDAIARRDGKLCFTLIPSQSDSKKFVKSLEKLRGEMVKSEPTDENTRKIYLLNRECQKPVEDLLSSLEVDEKNVRTTWILPKVMVNLTLEHFKDIEQDLLNSKLISDVYCPELELNIRYDLVD